MKQSFYLISAFAVLALACNADTKPAPDLIEKPKVEEIATPTPVLSKSDTLTASQLADVKTIHATFTEVYPISLNETTKNFKNNQDSGREIEIWLKMVETYKGLTMDGAYPKLEQRQEVFSVILGSTMMPLGTLKDKVEFNELTESEIDKIYSQFMNKFSNI